LRATIALGTIVFTDEYDIYAGVTQWGYEHNTRKRGKALLNSLVERLLA